MIRFERFSISHVLLITLIVFVALVGFMDAGLGFEGFRSDPSWYWEDSLAWRTPFNPYHVPAYPILIALLRTATWDLLPPLTVMRLVNLIALLASCYYVHRILRDSGIDSERASIGALSFAMWPCVGVTMAVHPLADVPAMAIYLAGVSSMERRNVLRGASLLGLSAVTHKIMWNYMAVTMFIWIFRQKPRGSWRNLAAVCCAGLPLLLLWLGGWWHHHDALWLWSSSVGIESRRVLPMFDGVLRTPFSGGIRGLVKGSLLMGVALLCAILTLATLFRRSSGGGCSDAIPLSTLILVVAVNEYEAWSVVRFGRLLMIPLLTYGGQDFARLVSRDVGRLALFALVGLFVASQFAFAWYIVRGSLP